MDTMTRQASRRWILTVIGLALSLGVAMLPLGNWGKAYSGLGKLWGGEMLWWTGPFWLATAVHLCAWR